MASRMGLSTIQSPFGGGASPAPVGVLGRPTRRLRRAALPASGPQAGREKSGREFRSYDANHRPAENRNVGPADDGFAYPPVSEVVPFSAPHAKPFPEASSLLEVQTRLKDSIARVPAELFSHV